MFRRSFIAAAALLGAMLLPGAASAQILAFSAPGITNMRAGPGPDFPVIAQVVGGSRVNVVGCLQGRVWCDSVVQGFRGWISTTRLEFPYAGRRVSVPRYYASFGAPIIGFDFGYWDRHYRGRSFFRDRDRWDRDWRDGRRYGDRGRRDRDWERDRDRRERGDLDFNRDERDRYDFADGRRGRRGEGREFERRIESGEMDVRVDDGERSRDRGEPRRRRGDSPEGCIVAGDGGLVCP